MKQERNEQKEERGLDGIRCWRTEATPTQAPESKFQFMAHLRCRVCIFLQQWHKIYHPYCNLQTDINPGVCVA